MHLSPDNVRNMQTMARFSVATFFIDIYEVFLWVVNIFGKLTDKYEVYRVLLDAAETGAMVWTIASM